MRWQTGADDVANLGMFPGEALECSYIQVAVCVGVLIESGAADFVVTGCSSGMGMALTCNSLPGVVCGYVANPTDAYLFGRINAGNAISFPLGLGFGWAGEITLRHTLEKLFEPPFGTGYPPEQAERKMRDTEVLKSIKALSHRGLIDLLRDMDRDYITPALSREPFVTYLNRNGADGDILRFVHSLLS